MLFPNFCPSLVDVEAIPDTCKDYNYGHAKDICDQHVPSNNKQPHIHAVAGSCTPITIYIHILYIAMYMYCYRSACGWNFDVA